MTQLLSWTRCDAIWDQRRLQWILRLFSQPLHTCKRFAVPKSWRTYETLSIFRSFAENVRLKSEFGLQVSLSVGSLWFFSSVDCAQLQVFSDVTIVCATFPVYISAVVWLWDFCSSTCYLTQVITLDSAVVVKTFGTRSNSSRFNTSRSCVDLILSVPFENLRVRVLYLKHLYCGELRSRLLLASLELFFWDFFRLSPCPAHAVNKCS